MNDASTDRSVGVNDGEGLDSYSTLFILYVSHALSAWTSRAFEFGATLFLAVIFPGTLLWASTYALLRALAATLFASNVGKFVDGRDRLSVVRGAMAAQRSCVAISCMIFAALIALKDYKGKGDNWKSIVRMMLFAVSILLAGVEKLAFVCSTVAVERDWVVVVARELQVERRNLNAMMRRIDLIAKLIAPVVVSAVETWWTLGSVLFVMVGAVASIGLEWIAVGRVYGRVEALGSRLKTDSSAGEESSSRRTMLQAWNAYFSSSVFLPSFSLSLLYLTVLSTGVQFQTFMFSIGYSSLAISLLRLLAVLSELSATCFAPPLIKRIGVIRAGLWSINWQVVCLAAGVTAVITLGTEWPKSIGAALTAGIVLSRLGLWGFDLSVQDIVQEGVPEDKRGEFSASEAALQNLFELLSFSTTVVFPDPDQFQIPVLISLGAVVLASICFAGYVRKERGHLVHLSKCLERKKYHRLDEADVESIALDSH